MFLFFFLFCFSVFNLMDLIYKTGYECNLFVNCSNQHVHMKLGIPENSLNSFKIHLREKKR